MAISVPALRDSAQTFATAADSSSEALNLLQIIDMAKDYTAGYTARSYWDSSGVLPTADSSMEGMTALVKGANYSTGNALYFCTGTEWSILKSLDSAGYTPPYSFQGSTSGYTSGGIPTFNIIDKFPFASNANATDVGDLTIAKNGTTGQSSADNGYTSGGYNPGAAAVHNVIDNFPFASDGNATDVGDLTVGRYNSAGQSSSASGYTSGGSQAATPFLNVIDKFPFTSNANATDVGDMTTVRDKPAGQSSTASGYTSGGGIPAITNIIDKFPFASDANATDVGDITVARSSVNGQSSTVSGYTSSGSNPGLSPFIANVIDKFPFASDANATDVGDLSVARYSSAGSQSSTASGYTSGGREPGTSNVIDKFPFASDANATDVGDLSVARHTSGEGQQV